MTILREIKMNSQGEAESLVCDGITQILLGVLGRGPKKITCHIFKEMIYVRVYVQYTTSENNLILSSNGCEILKDYRHNMMLGIDDTFKELINRIFNNQIGQIRRRFHKFRTF
jgi:uncharacterized protein YbcI